MKVLPRKRDAEAENSNHKIAVVYFVPPLFSLESYLKSFVLAFLREGESPKKEKIYKHISVYILQ